MTKGLRFWRLNADLTVRSAAEALNVHENTLRNWERNPGSVPHVAVLRLAELYRVTPEDIDFSLPENLQSVDGED